MFPKTDKKQFTLYAQQNQEKLFAPLAVEFIFIYNILGKNKIKNLSKIGFDHKPFGAKTAFPHSTQENAELKSWLQLLGTGTKRNKTTVSVT